MPSVVAGSETAGAKMNLLGAGPYLFSPFIAFDLWIWFETARVRTGPESLVVNIHANLHT